MTAVLAREAFGAEFVGADGFLNTPTYGLPPSFLIDALRDCIGQWQTGTMEVPVFDDYVRDGRAAYAALTGVPVESVTMGARSPPYWAWWLLRYPTAAGSRHWPVNSPVPRSRSPPRPPGV